MIEKKFRPERRYRKAIVVTRIQYLTDFFDEVLYEVANSGVEYCVKGDFYLDELSFIEKQYNLQPNKVRPSFKEKAFYCYINITNSKKTADY